MSINLNKRVNFMKRTKTKNAVLREKIIMGHIKWVIKKFSYRYS